MAGELPLPFGGDGEWLRCALHAHTTNSDGDTRPELVVAVEVSCSPARSVTLLAGRWLGSRVNADRPGYPGHGVVLETNERGEILAARLERPARTPHGRLEVEDSQGRRAWTNPLWMR
jgi:hypothetical protein